MESRKETIMKLIEDYTQTYTRDNKFTGDEKLREQIKQELNEFPGGKDKYAITSYILSRAAGYKKVSDERWHLAKTAIPTGIALSAADAALGGQVSIGRSLMCCFFGANVGGFYAFFKKSQDILTDPQLAREVKPFQDLMKVLELGNVLSRPLDDDKQNFRDESTSREGLRKRQQGGSSR